MSNYPHLFDDIGFLYRTTQLYTQRRQAMESPDNYKFTIEDLATFLIAEFGLEGPTSAVTISTGDTVAVPAGSMIEAIAIEAQSGARTVKIGTTAGSDNIMELSTIPTDTDFTFTLNRYTSSLLTLHFTITGGTASVIVFTKSKA